jgi:hypothetical protein
MEFLEICHICYFIISFNLVVVLGMEPMTLDMVSKQSTTKLHPSLFFLTHT